MGLSYPSERPAEGDWCTVCQQPTDRLATLVAWEGLAANGSGRLSFYFHPGCAQTLAMGLANDAALAHLASGSFPEGARAAVELTRRQLGADLLAPVEPVELAWPSGAVTRCEGQWIHIPATPDRTVALGVLLFAAQPPPLPDGAAVEVRLQPGTLFRVDLRCVVRVSGMVRWHPRRVQGDDLGPAVLDWLVSHPSYPADDIFGPGTTLRAE